IAKSDKWPITKSAVQSSSFLYDQRHLSIRGQKEVAIMRIRAELVHAAFDFFSHKGFTLINAPTMVQSACEGGSTLFELDYFGKTAYLTQSAQLYEEAAIEAFEKVFIFQPAFRAEKSKTTKHLTEFWMIEAERAFADYEDNMDLQEELLHSICERVGENRRQELSIVNSKFRPPSRPFPRLTYTKARDLASGLGFDFAFGQDPTTEAERALSLHHDCPFFITEYPLSARSFYHMTKKDDVTTLSSDLIAPAGYGEIATGGQRTHDYDTLVRRLKNQDIDSRSFDWYLDLRRYGVPPHSGFGLGIERTVRWICGLEHIRATSLFPRTISRISP
ncbi:MAG: asparagine--tRNA ligase, partial [Nitrososphaerales archaeon]